jgi:hypothetical protein
VSVAVIGRDALLRGNTASSFSDTALMAKKRGSRTKPVARSASAATVPAFLAALDHPLKPVLVDVLAAIRSASVGFTEGIKWNAPSFAGAGQQYFATVNVHTRGDSAPSVLLVLHRGPKARAGQVTVADPDRLLEWLGTERAVVRFETRAEVRSKRGALQAIVREWVTHL